MFDMDRFADRLAGQLSGGMKQKLALVCALVPQPQVLLLDEPTTGVDPVSRREFWDVLAHLTSEGLTILVATPYLDEAERCHRIAFMHQGEILRSARRRSCARAWARSGSNCARRTCGRRKHAFRGIRAR
jgi:ABC-2 type transport system ATP-binding protein